VQSAASAPPQGVCVIRRKPDGEFIVRYLGSPTSTGSSSLYNNSRNQARSQLHVRPWTSAEVIEHGERTQLLGYRNDLWRKNAGMDRRLVLKSFTRRSIGELPWI